MVKISREMPISLKMQSRKNLFLFYLISMLFLTGCGSQGSNNPAGSGNGVLQTGVASWYGEEYHGRPTASGEIFDMYKLTAAHRTLAFGSVVEVENLGNGRRVSVKVNDRGPNREDRIIDLAKAAVAEIGMVSQGTAEVALRFTGVR